MRLKHVEKVSFRASEQTNWLAFSKTHRDIALSLRKDDVVCFLSQTENQLVFIHGFDAWEDETGRVVQVLSTRRLRINTRWNPLMLANYAAQVGLELEGLKRFEEFYKSLKEAT